MRTVDDLKAEIARLEKLVERKQAVATLKLQTEGKWAGWVGGTVGKSRLFFHGSDLAAVVKAVGEFKLPE